MATAENDPGRELTVWTIGHSTRPIEEFLRLLADYHIEAIADVRSFPGSRKYPQYGKRRWRPPSQRMRWAITGCKLLAGVGMSRLIHRTPPGVMPRFVATPTTWPVPGLRKAWISFWRWRVNHVRR